MIKNYNLSFDAIKNELTKIAEIITKNNTAILVKNKTGIDNDTILINILRYYYNEHPLTWEHINNNPSILHIKPNRNNNITINEIQSINELARQTALLPGKKIILIHAADRMTAETANALLKISEELPNKTVIIFITTNPYRIPITILSRCISIAIRPLTTDQALHIISINNPKIKDRQTLRDILLHNHNSISETMQIVDCGLLETYKRIIHIANNDLPREKKAQIIKPIAHDENVKKNQEIIIGIIVKILCNKIAQHNITPEYAIYQTTQRLMELIQRGKESSMPPNYTLTKALNALL